MESLTCPNCGDAVPRQIRHVVMLTCPSCGTTLFLQGDRLENAGQSGEMHDAPQLFGIGDTVRLGRTEVAIHGHARFSYGRGFWEEFWGLDEAQRGCWVSVDEGDIVLQYPLERAFWPKLGPEVRVSHPFRYRDEDWRVTERDRAECVALRGAFGEVLGIGQTYAFVNAEGPGGELLSGEFSDGEASWFIGYWKDPFAVTVTRT